MRRVNALFITVLLSVLLTVNLSAQFGGGNGSANDPWQIATVQHLDNIRGFLGDDHSDKHFIQTANISFSGTEWMDGEGWTAVGSEGNRFFGNYNGNNMTIDSLMINRPESDYQGLFGYTQDATIANVNLTNVNITGNNYTGGLSGYTAAATTIINCSVHGAVTGGHNTGGLSGQSAGTTITRSRNRAAVEGRDKTGGLVGNHTANGIISISYNTGSVTGGVAVGGAVGDNTARISRCYSTGTISGTRYVGGFVGWNSSSASVVENSYSRGEVIRAATTNDSIAGFVGYNRYAKVINCYSTGRVRYTGATDPVRRGFCGAISTSGGYEMTSNYWDVESSGQTDTGGDATSRTSVVMKQFSYYSGWDFKGEDVNGAEGIWNIGNNRNDGYPYFDWQFPNDAGGAAVVEFSGGDGTEEFPYLISNHRQLSFIAFAYLRNPDVHFRLTNSINLGPECNEGGAYQNEGQGWIPLGNPENEFQGVFDGQNYAVDSIFINTEIINYKGLFGSLRDARVSNLRVTNVNIRAYDFAAGLTGSSAGTTTIANCSVTGSVTGRSSIGGIVGRSDGIMITGSNNSAIIEGGSIGAGGLAGIITSASVINNSFNTGDITGVSQVGGIAGGTSGRNVQINRCFSTGTISGSSLVGGAVGLNNEGLINHSYSRGEVVRTGGTQTNIGGFVGYNEFGKVIECYSTGRVRYTGLTEAIDQGFCGRIQTWGGYEMRGNYWDVESSRQTGSRGVATGRSSAAMKHFYLYYGWDFKGENINGTDGIWNIGNNRNDGYPYHDWQYPGDIGRAAVVRFAGGNGTELFPYLISDHRQLSFISFAYLKDPDVHFRLTNDINLGAEFSEGGAYHNEGHGWTALGDQYNPFQGVFDGQNYAIDSVFINSSILDYQGLFGYARGARIANLNLNVNITGNDCTAGLIGYTVAATTVSDCSVQGSVTGRDNVGGLTGQSEATTITSSSNSAAITGRNNIGGLAGQSSFDSSISNCSNEGEVTGTSYIGGITGHNYGGETFIIRCFSTGLISGRTTAGGVVGFNERGVINNSYSRGDVIRTEGTNTSFGGFAGYNSRGSIVNCYSTGSVTYTGATDPVNRGFCGAVWIEGAFEMRGNYWDTESSGQTSSEGIASGRTTAQMTYPHSEESYEEWDFQQIWDIRTTPNDGYPFLRWQGLGLNPPGWVLPPVGTFEHSMRMSGYIYADSLGTPLQGNRYWIGVFGPGGVTDCRGVEQNSMNGFFFHHIYGNEEETGTEFSIRVYDEVPHNSYRSNQTVLFQPEGNQGDTNIIFNTRYNLTISVQGQGQTAPARGTRSYERNQAVQLRAVAATGWTFSHWLINNEQVDEAMTNLVMNRNHNAIAVFNRNIHSLTINITGEGRTRPGEGVYQYGYGEIIKLNALPDSSHQFDRWVVGEEVYYNRMIIVTMNRDRVISCHFKPVPVDGFTLDRNSFLITETDEAHFFDIRATLYPANAFDRRVVWSSSDSTIAVPVPSEINPLAARVNIPVMGERTGTARISVTTIDGSTSASCIVVAIQTIIEEGPIEDTLSIEQHPFMVRGNIDISGRPSVTIEEGVVLFFEGDASVNVGAQLIANNVTFSGTSEEGRSRWQGLYFGENSGNSQLNGAVIINALEPLTIAGDTLNVINVTIDGGEYEYESFAVQVIGDCSPYIDSLFIDGYGKGIQINEQNGRPGRLTTASLSNIRVRHGTESIRPETVGIDVRGAVNLDLTDTEIDNFLNGLLIENYEENRALSTVSLGNIRVRHGSESIRDDAVAMVIGGNILAAIDGVDIDDYSTGLIFNSTYSGENTTSLANIRVRYGSESVRNPGITGVLLNNIPYLEFGSEESNNEVSGYVTGVHITAADDERAITTASLGNVRVRYGSESIRDDLTGILVAGNVNAEMSDIIIDDYITGIHYDNSLDEGTALFSNISIYFYPTEENSYGSVGMLLENMSEISLGVEEEDEVEIVGYLKGIEVITAEDDRAITTASLGNIRVHHSSESIRDNSYGLFFKGDINLLGNNIEIDDYATGIYHHNTLSGGTVSLGNIRVRHASESIRNPGLIGMHFVDVDTLIVGLDNDCEVDGYRKGIYVHGEGIGGRSISTVSLSNIRVKHSSESIRDESIGFLLTGYAEGVLFSNEIADYDVGVMIAAIGGIEVFNNSFIDCKKGVIIRGGDVSSTVSYNVLDLPSVYQIHLEAAAFVVDSLATAVINNNTVFMYPSGLITDDAEVHFFNNIIWQDALDRAVIQRNDGEADIRYCNISYIRYDGEGNISADPLFAAPYNGDFTLRQESPCIDAGDPEYELDADGTISDIGAFPYLRAPDPVFNHLSGVFDEPIQLTMTGTTDSTRIFYTLNGEEPTEESLLYNEPVEITTTTTVKAKAFFIEDHEWNHSRVTKALYIQALGPANVTATLSSGQVLLEWEAPGIWGDRRLTDPERRRGVSAGRHDHSTNQTRSLDGYNIYRRAVNDDEFTGINDTFVDSTSYRDDNLPADVYHYYITAVYFNETEIPSDTIRVSTMPMVAVNPAPVNDTTNVSVDLESLRWSYIVDSTHVNPVGFRVYFSDTDEFDDDFVWVPFDEDEENYSTAAALPEELDYFTQYYWKVVPTTIDPEDDDRSDSRSRRNSQLATRYLYGQDNVLSLRGDAGNVPIWTFRTEQYPNPAVAVNPVPVNDTTNVSIGLESLRWSYIIDSTHVNPVGFRVYFSDTDEFDDDFVWVAFDEDEENYSTAAALPEELDYFTQYYWKVVPTTIDPEDDDRSGSRSRRNSQLATRHSQLITRGDAENCPVWSFTTIAAVPFYEDFARESGWHLINGEQTNKWVIAEATAYTGERSAYISNNAGENNSYDVNSASIVHLYLDIEFPATPIGYDLTFWWKGIGEGTAPNCRDYMQLYLVDRDTVPTAGELLTEGIIGRMYNLQEEWTEEVIRLNAEDYSNTTKRLVFSWINNDTLGEQPPIAIDNINLKHTRIQKPVVSIEILDNEVMLSWEAVDHANAYKIFAADSASSNEDEWQHIATVNETEYREERGERPARFFRVVAFIERDTR